MDFDRILDTTGLTCPIPLLKLTKEIKLVGVGEVLKLISTDPGCESNVPIWCKRHKHELLNAIIEDNKLIFIIRRN